MNITEYHKLNLDPVILQQLIANLGELRLSANEWSDEAEVRDPLERVFDLVETRTLVSEDRTTLFWRSQRTH